MVDVAVQTAPASPLALKLMTHEVELLQTADEAEAYRRELALAFELLHLKNASLLHRVEYRKMAKWQPVASAPITPVQVGEDVGPLCKDGSLDMRCGKNFGLHKRTRMWQVQVPPLPAFTPWACKVDGDPDSRVRTNKVHQAKWAAAKTSCGPQQRS